MPTIKEKLDCLQPELLHHVISCLFQLILHPQEVQLTRTWFSEGCFRLYSLWHLKKNKKHTKNPKHWASMLTVQLMQQKITGWHNLTAVGYFHAKANNWITFSFLNTKYALHSSILSLNCLSSLHEIWSGSGSSNLKTLNRIMWVRNRWRQDMKGTVLREIAGIQLLLWLD